MKTLTLLGVLVVMALLALSPVQAQTTSTYIGTFGGEWNTATNWSSGVVPVSSDTVQVNAGSRVTIGTAGPVKAAAGTINISGQLVMTGHPNTLTASGIVMKGSSGFVDMYLDGGTLTLGGGTGSITTGDGDAQSRFWINGNMGALGLGSANVTYLELGSGNNADARLTINSGQTYTAEITVLNQNATSAQATLTLNGGTLNAGTLVFNNTPGKYINTFNLNAGTLTAEVIQRNYDGDTTTFNWNDGIIANRTGADLNINRSANAKRNLVISLAGTGTHAFDVQSGSMITVAATAALADKAGEQGTLTKTGAGSLILRGANTYTGSTTISAGTLVLAQSFATLAANSKMTIASGAQLQLDVATVTNQVASLVTNGVAAGNGLYSSANSSGFITGSGFLQVGAVAK